MAHGMDLRREGDALELKDSLGEIFDFEVRTFDDAPAETTAPAARRAEVPAARQQSDAKEPAVTGASALRAEPNFSRDLIDTYFRQMGDGALLSREQEIA